MKKFQSISVFALAGRKIAFGATLLTLAVLAGCANQSSSSAVYSRSQAQREQIVRVGTVTAVHPIVIQNDSTSGAGLVAGAALGGVAGNAVGGQPHVRPHTRPFGAAGFRHAAAARQGTQDGRRRRVPRRIDGARRVRLPGPRAAGGGSGAVG